MKKTIITILIIIGFIFAFYKLTSQKSDFILFYGNTCPHCKVVEEFITTNQIDQKLKISQLEVYENKSNTSVFVNMVKEICPDQSNPDGLPVPFLIDQKDKKCILGDAPINEYLSEKSK